jgi:hypothetical protein
MRQQTDEPFPFLQARNARRVKKAFTAPFT